MNVTEPKTCKCDCGHEMPVPIIPAMDGSGGTEYDVCTIVCPKCRRKANGGNYRHGTVDSWITPKALAESQREYERQLYEADCNEFYGRGEW